MTRRAGRRLPDRAATGRQPVRIRSITTDRHENSTIPVRSRRGRSAAWDWSEAWHHCRPVAMRYARDGAEADDILQEALIRAWRMRDTCRSPEAPWAWLRQITAREGLRM